MASMNVCVLGASGGLGASIADALDAAGHHVLRCYRRRIGGQADPSATDGSGEAFIDTSALINAEASLDRLFKHTSTQCVINAIGLGRSTLSPQNQIPIPTTELSLQEWEEIMYLNLKLPILITELAYKHQLELVIHIGSALTARGMHGTAMAQAYSASKRGLFDFCEIINQRDDDEFTTACIAPGLVQTRMTDGSGLRMLFDGELKPETVAAWTLAVLDNQVTPLSIILPLPAAH
ncbi:SDR family NAD(P)-dependent oxidoreductase [Hyphomonas sp.]|jgi:NAD(P)-dependent dehydrogenase (short-subunit alcohol dehydrogenase family)|uniref:SDR family NAD(P)-dependent oxidoreductase n=1 Tax=Hyphomonas sp. TaxID=87 RepID=UPI0037C17BF5